MLDRERLHPDDLSADELHAEVDRIFGPCLRPDCPTGRHLHPVQNDQGEQGASSRDLS